MELQELGLLNRTADGFELLTDLMKVFDIYFKKHNYEKIIARYNRVILKNLEKLKQSIHHRNSKNYIKAKNGKYTTHGTSFSHKQSIGGLKNKN